MVLTERAMLARESPVALSCVVPSYCSCGDEENRPLSSTTERGFPERDGYIVSGHEMREYQAGRQAVYNVESLQ